MENDAVSEVTEWRCLVLRTCRRLPVIPMQLRELWCPCSLATCSSTGLLPLLLDADTPRVLSHHYTHTCNSPFLRPGSPQAAWHAHSPPQHLPPYLEEISVRLTSWKTSGAGWRQSTRIDIPRLCCRRAEGRRCRMGADGRETRSVNLVKSSLDLVPLTASGRRPHARRETAPSTRITQ